MGKKPMITKSVHYLNANRPQIENYNSKDYRIGFFAEVLEVDSTLNACTILSDTGLKLKGIPVCSHEFVTQKNKYIVGERKLPETGSCVFVLMPNGNITSAFILCSFFPLYEDSLRALQATEADKIKKNKIHEKVTMGGWNEKENYDNGNRKITSYDGSIEININTSDYEDDKKGISLKAWNNKIVINPNGVEVSDNSGNSISSNSDGISVSDVFNNKINATRNGIEIKDSFSNSYIMDKEGIQIKDANKNSLILEKGKVTINDNLEILT